MTYIPGGGSGSSKIGTSDDVALNNPSAENVLAYDVGIAKWTNIEIDAMVARALSDQNSITRSTLNAIVSPTQNNPNLPQGTPVLSATAVYGQNNLSISGVTGATSYQVYRDTSADITPEDQLVATVTTPSYADTAVTAGTTYYYRVMPVNGFGVGASSNEVSVYSPSDTAGSPDLIVTSIITDPAVPKAGDAVTFSAVVNNQGTAATPAGIVIGVNFAVDGAAVAWSDTNSTSLAVGASVTLTANSGPSGMATWTAVSGVRAVRAWVNDTGRFVESNTTNNTLTTNITVGDGTVVTNPPAGVETTSVSSVRRSEEFCRSVGVCTHLTYGGSYSDYNRIFDKLVYLGGGKPVYIRDGWGTNRSKIANWINDTYGPAGGRVCLVQTPGIDFPNTTEGFDGAFTHHKQYAQYLEYVEGPNEKDSQPEFNRDTTIKLSQMYRGDTATQHVKITNGALADTNSSSKWAAVGDLSAYIDAVATHPYPGNRFMQDDYVNGLQGARGRNLIPTPSGTPVQAIITETGWGMGSSGDYGKRMPNADTFAHQHLRIYLEVFRGFGSGDKAFNNRRVFKYELFDQGNTSETEVERRFGFFDSAGNPYKGASSVRNMMLLLRDNGTNALTFSPTNLGHTITGASSKTRSFLMQKSDGSWWIAIWEQVQTWNGSGAVYPAPVKVTVSWSGSKSVAVYKPTAGASAIQTGSGSSVQVASSYDPLLIRVS